MKNGQLARAVCFQESADEGNADYIEGRLYRRFLRETLINRRIRFHMDFYT